MRIKQLPKILALLMIYLVLSLTLISASVFASIFNAEVYGKDNAPGIVRPSDTLTVRTSSALPCSVSSAFTNNTFTAMTCGSGTPLSCSYTKSMTNMSGEISVGVQEQSSGETTEVYAYVDNTKPVITSFSTASLGGRVRGTYIIVDQASLEYQDKCAGIKKVELVLNNQVVNTTSHTAGLCNVNSAITGTLPNYIGYVNTSIRVLDYVDLPANATGTTVFIDSIPPKIKSAAKIYKTGTEEEVKLVSTNSTLKREVDVVVEVDDNGLPPTGSVFGDFTNFDKVNGASQNNIASSCTQETWNSTYKCRFTGIKLLPTIANPKIMITATDQAQNAATANITVSFTAVNNAGTVTKLGPEQSKCTGGNCYVKAGINNITATISSSSSFNDSNIFIQGAQATCSYETGWKCQANAQLSAGTTQLTLTGTDDLGNPITGTGAITVDANAPKKVGAINVTPDCPTSKQSLKIEMNVSETESPTLTIKADTGIISTNNLTTANCVKGTFNWKCALTVSGIKEQEINTNLKVMVEDLAGNQLVENIPVSICVELAEIPDLIEKIKTRGALPKVDRKVASKITVKVPIGLNIITKADNVEIMQRSNVDCSATPGISGSAYMINDDGLKPTLIIPLKYDKDWDEDDKIHVNCTQEYMIKHGNKIYTQEETESITAELSVYNQALGTLDQTYQDLIETHKARLRELDQHKKTWETVNSILGTWCDIAETAGQINSVVQSAKTVIGTALIALDVLIGWTGIGAGAIELLWKPVQTAAGGFDNTVQLLFWPVGWSEKKVAGAGIGGGIQKIIGGSTNKIGLISKSICTIYNCKFYDFNTYISILMSMANDYVEEQVKMAQYEQEMKKILKDNGNTNIDNFGANDKKAAFEEATQSVSNRNDKLKPGEEITNIVRDGNNYRFITNLDSTGTRTLAVAGASNIRKYVAWTETNSLLMGNSKDMFLLNQALNGYLDSSGGTWILNPYKSTHYDSLCIPATIYNDNKEKQIICKHITCLETLKQTGGPLEVCDFDYELGMCLYVDSAQYKYDKSAWTTFFKNIIPAMMNSLAGAVITMLYMYFIPVCNPTTADGSEELKDANIKLLGIKVGGCIHYQEPVIKIPPGGGFLKDIKFHPNVLCSITCGTLGTLLSFNEIREVIDNKFRMPNFSPTKLPGTDYCEGINYAATS
ncbi:hypothetical protein JW756_00725 [Candidatus Woesearchaeota archaeon]|nr:hypothetical protein [Candidatus Woesearchaeota archaeon]